jgi:DUF1680 family protein
MKQKVVSLFILFILVTSCQEKKLEPSGSLQPVPFTAVKMTDQFWAPRIRLNHDVTIPIAIKQSTITGRIKNFEIAGGLAHGSFCSIYPFDDSDVYKIIEGASYALQTTPDPTLEAYLDTLIYKIGLAQEDDGYIYTNRTIAEMHGGAGLHEWASKKRWENDHILSHELYNLGHMYEAAVAHYQATGKRTFLDIALKSAELVNHDLGWGKMETYPGHQEIEIGLVKLYRVTGDKRWLDLAKFFLDVRGPNGEEYNQAHKKVIDQDEAVGHAVRACYMYSAMADVAALTNDSAYIAALTKIWNDVVYKKIYITGGIGASGGNEGFAGPYNLPNMSAYCETCASIANVFWNQRMFLQKGESKYFDVLEKILYNALLSGVSLSGNLFFYPNPLESLGQHARQEWFGCACCPSNICRFIPSVPGYVYAKTDNQLYINLYASNTATVDLMGQTVGISQETNYPWDGTIQITLNPQKEQILGLMLRLPGWVNNEAIPGDLYHFTKQVNEKPVLRINGKQKKIVTENGYVVINRKWKPGDVVELVLPMEPRLVAANQKLTADSDKVAVQRGPLMYCAEWPDQPDGHVLNQVFSPDAGLSVEARPDLLNGVTVLKAKARGAKKMLDGKVDLADEQDLTLIPYYSWANRGAGEMMVWMPLDAGVCRPLPAPTIAFTSTISASHVTRGLMALNDQYEPENSNDHSTVFYHWWPKTNTTEWVQYTFQKPETVSRVKVYWFDDGPDGGCRIPDSWQVKYLDGQQWKPVKNLKPYKVTKDAWDQVDFEVVKTSAVRLEVRLGKDYSSGIHEWVVE